MEIKIKPGCYYDLDECWLPHPDDCVLDNYEIDDCSIARYVPGHKKENCVYWIDRELKIKIQEAQYDVQNS